MELNKTKDDNESIIHQIQTVAFKMKELKSSFIEKCLIYFDELINDNKYHNDTEKYPEDLRLVIVKQEKFLETAKEYYSKYEKLKENNDKKIKLYSLNITSKILFPIVGALYNSK